MGAGNNWGCFIFILALAMAAIALSVQPADVLGIVWIVMGGSN